MNKKVKVMEGSNFREQESTRRMRRYKRNGIAVASLLIIWGVLLVCVNTGLIGSELVAALVSWQYLLVVAGIFAVANRSYGGGVMMIGLGVFFLIGKNAGPGWFSIYWPVLLVVAGLVTEVKLLAPSPRRSGEYGKATRVQNGGFVDADTSFGSYEHVVLDEVFTGASIRGSFSGTVLDLRHTTLPAGETYIDVDCTLAGVELWVPCDWQVVSEVKFAVGGVTDKRRGVVAGKDRKLVLRGGMTLAGIEIKC